MGDTEMSQNPDGYQFSKFVNEIPLDDFVEIPLFSDGENDPTECYRSTVSQDATNSLIELEPVYPPQSNSKSTITAFFEPAHTPSPLHYKSAIHLSRDGAKCEDLNDEDVEDDLSFNEDLANAIRHQCSLFSPSLVRAINSDIKEIKRSLAAPDCSKDDNLNFSQNERAVALPTAAQVEQSQNPPRIINDEDFFGRNRLFKGHQDSKHSGSRKEHKLPRSVFVNRDLRQTRSKMIKSPGQPNGGKKDELTIRQWKFAAPANVAYSSSENSSIAANSDAEGSVISNSPLSQKEGGDAIVTEVHDKWSLKRCPPCPSTTLPPVGSSHGGQGNETLDSFPVTKRSQRIKKSQAFEPDYGSDEDTDQLLDKQYRSDKPVEIPELKEEAEYLSVKKRRGREVAVHHPDFPGRLIEGRLYRCRYLGSTQLLCEDHPSKTNRLHQAQEAVQRVKAPDGETQPSVPVEIFVSTERILILNKDLDEIVMDHDLRLISYIADVGSILVLMARRPHPSAQRHSLSSNASPSPQSASASAPAAPSEQPSSNHPVCNSAVANTSGSDTLKLERGQDRAPAKIICHLFESDETQMITQAIGQAFQEAYFEFLRQNGIDDPEAFHERTYQNTLHQQEIFKNELAFFSDKEQEKEVIVPKQKGEALGVVIVESGWGSVLPTAVLANMHPSGPAARCGQLNIGNRIISINGQSLVGLPLATCQALFKATKNQTAVKLVVVNCSPVVEVLIRRPDQKFQLGFSVQDGVICSLLRGGIAERGGIRVDHRIIEINGESVVAVPHELLTGQDTPHYI